MVKIGWSSKIISMEGPVAITGQMHQRISKGILDHNTLTALVMSDGVDVTIMVSADLISAMDGIILEIRNAVREKNSEIPAEKILLSTTHTHTSPRYMRKMWYDKAPADRMDIMDWEIYRQFLVNQASDAVVEAYENQEEGSFSYGYGFAVTGHHRRPVYFDNLQERPGVAVSPLGEKGTHAQMYGKTNDAMFAGYEGAADYMVNFLFTFDKEGKLNGAVVNVPCPSQCSEHEELLSADYWAQTRELIRKEYGDIFILSQCACAGDLAPRMLHYKEANKRRYALKYGDCKAPNLKNPNAFWERCEIAERIKQAFDEVYAWAQKEKFTEASIIHHVKNIPLEAWQLTKEQYEEACQKYEKLAKTSFIHTNDAEEDYRKNTVQSAKMFRYGEVIKRYENGAEYIDTECHVIRIGEVAICSHPFELYTNYHHRILARSPFVQTFVVQLAAAAEDPGYLCTSQAEDNMSYGANVLSNSVSAEGGERLVKELLDELEQLWEE